MSFASVPASAVGKSNDSVGKKAEVGGEKKAVVAGPRFERPDVVYIHYPCPDGLSARVLIEDYYRAVEKESKHNGGGDGIEFRLWEHGEAQNLADLAGKVVWFRDVLPPLAVLDSKEVTCAKAADVKDHHWNETNKGIMAARHNVGNTTIALDSTDTCGALMTYRHLFGDKMTVPYWLEQINKGDTNLIGTRTPDEKAYHCFITQPEFLPVSGDTALFRKACQENREAATATGYKILTQREQTCLQECKRVEYGVLTCAKGTFNVAYVSVAGPHMISLMYDTLIKQRNTLPPFDIVAVRWTKASTQKPQISLRRPPESKLDLSEIAKLYGGGGHPAASGIQGRHTL